MAKKYDLPISAFLVLALIAEGKIHGYELERLVKNRGFQYWTDIQRSSIYNALKMLEKQKLITVTLEEGGGPIRKVYRITSKGSEQLATDGFLHLSQPAQPHNEIDLGMYSLPFMDKSKSLKAIKICQKHLHARLDFIKERFKWCEKHHLELPMLAFERAWIALEAELKWLERVQQRVKKGNIFTTKDWQIYEYKEPPHEP